jgi:hypothetical protein
MDYSVSAGGDGAEDVAVTHDRSTPAEQRLYDAVARWNPDTGHGMPDVIDAACQALIDGLDSPTLRELAGASLRDRSTDVRELTDRALDELAIPRPAERTAGRLVLTYLDREALLSHGLAVSWVANDYRDPDLFRVALQLDDDYQIFVDTPWRKRSPEELAEEVCEILGRGPGKWRASWHATKPSLPGPPTIARRSWRQEGFR